ncbi:hypothetical protein Tco_0286742, partial [Tanacetum coccineum]
TLISIDLSYSGLEEFQEPEFVGYGVKVDKIVSENSSVEIKKTPDAPIIEEWVSDDEEQDESSVVVKKKTVIPTADKIEKPVRKPVRYAEMYRHAISVEVLNTCSIPVNTRDMLMIKNRMIPVNAAKPKAAYNVVKRNRFNTVKASACWVWMPKNIVIDHMDAQAQGRQECSKEKEESGEECSKSRKTKKMKCLEDPAQTKEK